MNKHTLYKKTSAGIIEQWSIWTEDNKIVTEHGQIDGKLIRSEDVVVQGKNLGKKNETSPTQQAELEARAKHAKKIERNGYVADIERARIGETDQEGGIAPMLAVPHEDHAKKLVYPAMLQRKYNGVRCIAVYENGATTLWSRKREQMLCVPHIADAVTKLFEKRNERIVLDGEVYKHGWSLQKIASFARQKKTPKPGYEELEYHVYDNPSHDGTNEQRHEGLHNLLRMQGPPIVLVTSHDVNSEAEAWALHDRWVQDGYEGAIGRNLAGLYEPGRRSPNLHKFKRFDEREFEIIGHKLGRGKFADIPVLICKTDEGGEFDCNLPGTLEERAAIGPATLVGKKLTVKHFGWTDAKLPSFPVGVAVRDYE